MKVTTTLNAEEETGRGNLGTLNTARRTRGVTQPTEQHAQYSWARLQTPLNFAIRNHQLPLGDRETATGDLPRGADNDASSGNQCNVPEQTGPHIDDIMANTSNPSKSVMIQKPASFYVLTVGFQQTSFNWEMT